MYKKYYANSFATILDDLSKYRIYPDFYRSDFLPLEDLACFLPALTTQQRAATRSEQLIP